MNHDDHAKAAHWCRFDRSAQAKLYAQLLGRFEVERPPYALMVSGLGGAYMQEAVITVDDMTIGVPDLFETLNRSGASFQQWAGFNYDVALTRLIGYAPALIMPREVQWSAAADLVRHVARGLRHGLKNRVKNSRFELLEGCNRLDVTLDRGRWRTYRTTQLGVLATWDKGMLVRGTFFPGAQTVALANVLELAEQLLAQEPDIKKGPAFCCRGLLAQHQSLCAS